MQRDRELVVFGKDRKLACEPYENTLLGFVLESVMISKQVCGFAALMSVGREQPMTLRSDVANVQHEVSGQFLAES